MISWCCLFFSVVVQYTSGQAIPYGIPSRSINANNARGMQNAMTMGRGLPNGMALSNNQIVRNIPMAANNMARGNNVNRQNLANPYYANNKVVNNFSYGKVANPNMANANIVESNLENPLTHASQVLANDITAAALENFANTNIFPNVGTAITNKRASYNFGNSAIPVTVTGTSHGSQPVGINILADNLEVKGMVSVVGRMPIFGAVTLNGNVPSDGKASVNYSCGSPAAV